MTDLITVKDYEKWKPHFDKHSTVRKAGGSKGDRLFRGIDNPNDITIVWKWDTI